MNNNNYQSVSRSTRFSHSLLHQIVLGSLQDGCVCCWNPDTLAAWYLEDLVYCLVVLCISAMAEGLMCDKVSLKIKIKIIYNKNDGRKTHRGGIIKLGPGAVD